jgi:hypothetical protein
MRVSDRLDVQGEHGRGKAYIEKDPIHSSFARAASNP